GSFFSGCAAAAGVAGVLSFALFPDELHPATSMPTPITLSENARRYDFILRSSKMIFYPHPLDPDYFSAPSRCPASGQTNSVVACAFPAGICFFSFEFARIVPLVDGFARPKAGGTEKRAPQNRLWSARRCAYLRIPPPAESLFQSFYESGDGGGVVSGKRGDGFLVGRFLGIVAFGEQAGD